MKPTRIQFSILALCVLAGLGLHHNARAYDPQVSTSLKKSKDALLAQRAELLDACDKRKAQITQLEQEIDRLQGYIRDTDRTLKDIDIALSRNN